MKICLMTDMEGVAGVYDSENYCHGEKACYYDYSRHLLTEEVNAAVRGFFKGGADAVRVVTGHCTDSVILDELDERATLVQGHYLPIWPWGLDQGGFDALAFVGQHAKAGTGYSHLTHTGSKRVLDQRASRDCRSENTVLWRCARWNWASQRSSPPGEEALCREAEALTPGVFTVAGERSIVPDGGRIKDMTFQEYERQNLGAEHRNPKVVRRMLEEEAEKAVRKLQTDPGSFRYLELSRPYYLVWEFRAGSREPGSRPFAVAFESDSFIEAMNGIYDPGTPRIPLEQVKM